MSNRKFYILLSIIIGIGLLITIGHIVYLCLSYENASIIKYISKEWWG